MPAIEKVRYTHDGMIDLIIASPAISQGEIARHFGYSETWVSIIFNSDAFKARLAQRKQELIDPLIITSIEEKLTAIANAASEVVLNEVLVRRNPDFALKALDRASAGLGLGKKAEEVTNNTFVAVLPAKAASAAAWLEKFAPGGVIEAQVVNSGE